MADKTRRELVVQLQEIIGKRCHATGIARLRVEPHGDKLGSVHIHPASYKKTNFTDEELVVLRSLGISTGANFSMIPYQNLQKVVERISAAEPEEALPPAVEVLAQLLRYHDSGNHKGLSRFLAPGGTETIFTEKIRKVVAAAGKERS